MPQGGFWQQATGALPGAYRQAYSQYMYNLRQKQEEERLERQRRIKQKIADAKARAKQREEEHKQHLKVMAEHKKAIEGFRAQSAAMKIANKRLEPLLKSGKITSADYEAIMQDIEANPKTAGAYVSRVIKATQPPKPTKPTEAELKRQMVVTPYAGGPMTRAQLQTKQTATLEAADVKAQKEREAQLSYQIAQSDPAESIGLPPYEQWRQMPQQRLKFGEPYGKAAAPGQQQASEATLKAIEEAERAIKALEDSLTARGL